MTQSLHEPTPMCARIRFRDKRHRREVSAWLAHHCGRPSQLGGFWWARVDNSTGETCVYFVLDQHFTLFTLTWCL